MYFQVYNQAYLCFLPQPKLEPHLTVISSFRYLIQFSLKTHSMVVSLIHGCYNFLLKFFQHFCLKLVYFLAIFLKYMYIIFQYRSTENTSNSSTQVLVFCCPYRHLKFKFQAYLPLSI